MTHRARTTLRLLLEAIGAGLIVGLVIIFWQSHSNQPAAPVSYANAVSRAAPAVVNIYTTRQTDGRRSNSTSLFDSPQQDRLEGSLGSGVIVSKAGYVLTSYHVVKQADSILAALQDGRETEASIVGIDPATDLALLQIHLPQLPVIDLEEREPVQVGEVVLAIGNPMGIGQTVSMGIVGATGRSHLGIATFENFIQTDAAINQGNSGGALVDTEGRLVGINTAILSNDGRWQGIGFATPASVAGEVMHDLIKYGHVIRGYLGVSVQDLSPAQAQALGLPTPLGGLITEVVAGSPAAQAGLLPGDLLLAINGQVILNGYDAMNRVAGTRPGEALLLQVRRNSRIGEARAVVGERPFAMDSRG